MKRAARWSLVAAMMLSSATLTAQTEPLPDPLQLRGSWQQGGLIVGTAPAGAEVWFNGRALRLSTDGRFAFGLAHEEAPAAELRVKLADGSEQRLEYAVLSRAYEEQRIDKLPPAMVDPPKKVLKRIEAENARVAAARAQDTDLAFFADAFRWPVSATVTGVYGSRRVLNGQPKQPHFGIDLAAAEGTPVRAAGGGRVTLADPGLYYTGGTVILDHGHGVSTTYLHLSKLDVKAGQGVAPGQAIGKVGKTGRATGPHLCWRANWFDTRLDPSLLVSAEAAQKGENK